MSTRWGEPDKEGLGEDEEVIPGEVVKYLVMQAMKQTPYNSTKRSVKVDLNGKTIGLELDDRVIHTIKLRQYAREMKEYFEQKEANPFIEPPLSVAVPEHSIPILKHGLSYPLQFMEKTHSDFVLGKRAEIPEITEDAAKQLLSKAVAALLVHSGFDTTTESVLATITEATESYVTKMVKLMRVAVDSGENVGAAGFPDAVERVFSEMRIGSTRELHKYYQENIITTHERLLFECQNLNLQYRNSLPDT